MSHLDELVHAILIASDPAQAALHQHALDYLSNIQSNARDTWPLALALFVDLAPNGARRHPPQARFFGLRVLDEFFDNRFEPLEPDTFRTLQQSFLSYIQSEFVYGPAEAGATFLRNKFSHTLTLLFLSTYIDQWKSFFTDLFSLTRPAESSSPQPFNRHLSLLFFHLVLEISGEVADQMIKSARQFNPVRHDRDGRVRDAVRQRDAAQINQAVLAIVQRGSERMAELRGNLDPSEWPSELDDVVEVVDCGIRTFASYVGWIDISLSVTPATVPLLFGMLSDHSLPIRLATSAALLRIVAKGLKETADKLRLIKVLSLGHVITALEAKTRVQQVERGSDVDEGEESYREALGKLLNVLGLELAKLTEDGPDDEIRAEATTLLEEILPVMLQFMSDEYDDTSSTIFPLLQTILSNYKRTKKLTAGPLDESKRSFLASLLTVILKKMKWDESVDPDEVDEDDKVAFEGLRKELRTFMDAVSIVDRDLVTEAVQTFTLNTLNAYNTGLAVKWHDAELAVYLVYIFGEVNKSGGKGRAAFCLAPTIEKDKRKLLDYSEYSLTSHGEMLRALVQSGISAYPHSTVVMQFFETAARYGDFFKIRKECIVPTLEAMLGTRGLHNPNSHVHSRVFYLFYRFIRDTRNDIPVDLVVHLLDGFRDILPVRVETPETEEIDQQAVLAEAVNNPSIFDSQLYLFETAGALVSVLHKSLGQQAPALLSTVKPLLDGLSASLHAATKNPQEILPVLEIHHIIMALGNVAKGFPDFPFPPPTEAYTLPPLDTFGQVAQAILVCLEAMNVFKVVRDATRFAFARIIAILGPNVTRFIPPLMTNLLTHFEPSELVDFMSFIGLLMHKLHKEMFDTLDQLIGPLSTHIISLLSQSIEDKDEKVRLTDTKKGYITLLNSVMVSQLQDVFISERNKSGFETILGTMLSIAEDISDPASQKASLVFMGRCVQAWGGHINPTSLVAGSSTALEVQGALPGFEQFIYQRLVPTVFRVPSSPTFNPKDGQTISILHEIANLLQIVCRSRGNEAYNYFLTVFLPSQNWPPDTALQFMEKLRDLDNKSFRKYFTDFVRSSRS